MSPLMSEKSVLAAACALLLGGGLLSAATPPASAANRVPQSALSARLGCTDIPASQITSFPDGGTDYIFDTPGGAVEMPVPPAGFDPLTADASARSRYGFPEMPSGAAQQRDWHAAMAAYRETETPSVCWNSAPPPPARPGQLSSEETSTGDGSSASTRQDDDSETWAGYVATAKTGNSYRAVEGNWIQPTRSTSRCTNAQEVAWVGIGGYRKRSDGKSMGLVQDGTAYDPSGAPYAWYEYVGADTQGNRIGVSTQPFGLTVSPGDTVQAETQYDPSAGQAKFYIQDVTTGQSQSKIMALGSQFYDGRDSDWIIERPSDWATDVPSPLQNFTDIRFSAAQVENQDYLWQFLGDAATQTNVKMLGDSGFGITLTTDLFGTNNGSFKTTYEDCQ